MNWTLGNIPPQTGRLAVVTGASGGLGLEIARALADAGATVIVAARNAEKSAAAVARIGGSARFVQLDLADLDNIRDFATRVGRLGQPVSLLVNNAGLAAPPTRRVTRDGFELQFGTNFLGHFALTALLRAGLIEAGDARVVTVSSIVERSARINLDDLMSEASYSATKSYAQSKLANLLFARELQRRSDEHHWGLVSVAAHPGIAVTELTKSRPGQPVLRFNRFFEKVSPYIGQGAAAGALPILYAATSPDVKPGGYYGPQGFGELKGPPGPARIGKAGDDAQTAGRLWRAAEKLTGIAF